jgi:hypothetical protein
MISQKTKTTGLQEKEEKEVQVLMEPVVGGTYVW